MSLQMEFDYIEVTSVMDLFSQENINLLREWTQKLDSSKSVPKNLTDQQLVLFYNACYGEMERVKTCIEKYYSIRKNAPDLFDNRSLSFAELKQCEEALEFSVLPGKSVEGYDVIFHRLHLQEPSKYNLEPAIRMLFMTVDACMHKRGPQPGYMFLFDMRGVKFGHLTRLSLSTLRKFFQYVQEAMPVRMRAIHVLNTESVLDKLMLIIKPFMDKKFYDMIKFHSKTEDMEKFYETVVPRSSLPSDYGGSLPDTQTLHKKCMLQLRALEPFFQAEQAQRASALAGKRGIEHSFQKLDID